MTRGAASPPGRPAPDASGGVRIESWSGGQFARRLSEAMAIYVQAMHYAPSAGVQRGITARRHATHSGFACRVALDSRDNLVGFGFGYTTTPGQWWHDLVRRAIGPAQISDWLVDAFELSELHVLPRSQGAGIGRQVLLALAGDIPHRSMLLSTPDADTRAFRMYRSLGFVDLARQYLFPGDARPFAVLGARLPLSDNRPVPGADAARG
jgi:ribosomal protein S18 acetylase RimI-like enzyme